MWQENKHHAKELNFKTTLEGVKRIFNFNECGSFILKLINRKLKNLILNNICNKLKNSVFKYPGHQLNSSLCKKKNI